MTIEKTGTLYVVATPIGNLADICERALETLRAVDMIACEDTRVTKRLLDRYDISTPTVSYHQHSKATKIDYIASLLESGKSVALVSDAGTPGISDPGSKLVEAVYEKGVKVEVIPGPSAVTAALSVSGLPSDKFIFLGFAPTKKGREKFFTQVADSELTVVFYESVHRIEKALEQLASVLDSKRTVVVCRELTKMFESIYRGNAQEVLEQLRTDKIKGEFVVIVEGT
ncbi:MAG: 16S rRNA (cytidine(1402)-2'-O)-methyltransferase [Parcubacteria group bacterium]|nr:16S rRNA (cytidine(1402)-2'-O)-methyltransferase [Parcubacteria group bacterium]